MQSNTYDAQFGRTGGGTINVSLKSGTNKLHGSLTITFATTPERQFVSEQRRQSESSGLSLESARPGD